MLMIAIFFLYCTAAFRYVDDCASVLYYTAAFRYGIDETSPEDYVEDALFSEAATTYQILSKPIGVRQSALKSPVAINGNANFVPSAAACCGNHCHHH